MFEAQHIPREAIKEEPFAEFYVPEAILESAESVVDSDACCLCPEGSRIQNLLFEHIQIAHPENGEFHQTG
jgi:hypothetical protein